MPDGSENYSARTVDRIAAIPAAIWDACAGADNPFVGHAFLSALEDTGCVSRKTGWLAQHAVLEDAGGTVRGVAPLYLKGHSYGEYVFDHGWAEAFERAGGQYYPKLQGAVPFTPVTGPRLLVPPGPRRTRDRRALLAALVQIARQLNVSSLHLTFMAADEAEAAGEAGYLIRHGMQYHWENRGYSCFDDFLGALASRKRKTLRKEREQLRASGVEVVALTGAELRAAEWDRFYRFYCDTYDRKWGSPYLTREFFARLADIMPESVVLMVARREGEMIAGALNLRGSDALYGRNWGCALELPFLHFETCYYQAIDFAIRHGLKRVEAGTQGPHKVQRGYLPVRMHSAHWLADSGFRKAVAQFLDREKAALAADLAAMAAHSPYRRAGESE